MDLKDTGKYPFHLSYIDSFSILVLVDYDFEDIRKVLNPSKLQLDILGLAHLILDLSNDLAHASALNLDIFSLNN